MRFSLPALVFATGLAAGAHAAPVTFRVDPGACSARPVSGRILVFAKAVTDALAQIQAALADRPASAGDHVAVTMTATVSGHGRNLNPRVCMSESDRIPG